MATNVTAPTPTESQKYLSTRGGDYGVSLRYMFGVECLTEMLEALL